MNIIDTTKLGSAITQLPGVMMAHWDVALLDGLFMWAMDQLRGTVANLGGRGMGGQFVAYGFDGFIDVGKHFLLAHSVLK